MTYPGKNGARNVCPRDPRRCPHCPPGHQQPPSTKKSEMPIAHGTHNCREDGETAHIFARKRLFCHCHFFLLGSACHAATPQCFRTAQTLSSVRGTGGRQHPCAQKQAGTAPPPSPSPDSCPETPRFRATRLQPPTQSRYQV